MMNEFDRLEAALQALEEAEALEARRRSNLADWSDPAAKREYVASYKRKRREAVLPDPRVCPVCEEPKPSSRRWVVFPRAKLAGLSSTQATRVREKSVQGQCAVCRACAMKHFAGTLWRNTQ